MKLDKNRKNNKDPKTIPERALGKGIWSPSLVRFPGLTADAGEIQQLNEALFNNSAIFSYKQVLPCLWVVFMGGTGTGKSTLFNSFCGDILSDTGVERPKTSGPVLYAHRDCALEDFFPFDSIEIERRSQKDSFAPATGRPGKLTILEHMREELSHIIVVDTPDLDSVEMENRRIAENLYLLSDFVIFVTSQEKYADDVPYQFLQRVIQEQTPYLFLLNKARDRLGKEEILSCFQNQGVSLNLERLKFIPYVSSSPSQSIPEQPLFREFLHFIQKEISKSRVEYFHRTGHSRIAEAIKRDANRLMELLDLEKLEGEKWLSRLEALFQETAQSLVENEKGRFAEKSREYLGREIRNLFAKYDVLGKPRRFIREALLTPFRLLGFWREDLKESRRKELLKARRKTDLSSIRAAVEAFNRRVLEELSPPDRNAPLFLALRRPGIALEDEEIEKLVRETHDELALWLEHAFRDLASGIPEGKKWGIYTTSILWGVLILSFETVLGGGFSLLDAALDAALAPFITKGAVELFAYREIRKIAGELAKRYHKGLLSTLRLQRERYENCLQTLITRREALEVLNAFAVDIAKE